jgi:RNA polymerase sigma-70 factor (ECF subfamily)
MVANWHRDHSRRTIIALEDVAHWTMGDHSPEFAAQLMEDREALRLAIGRLPADRQELLMLKFQERLSNAEIGEILGRSEGAVKSLYHRTLLSLRGELAEPETETPEKKPSLFKRPFRRN